MPGQVGCGGRVCVSCGPGVTWDACHRVRTGPCPQRVGGPRGQPRSSCSCAFRPRATHRRRPSGRGSAPPCPAQPVRNGAAVRRKNAPRAVRRRPGVPAPSNTKGPASRHAGWYPPQRARSGTRATRRGTWSSPFERSGVREGTPGAAGLTGGQECGPARRARLSRVEWGARHGPCRGSRPEQQLALPCPPSPVPCLPHPATTARSPGTRAAATRAFTDLSARLHSYSRSGPALAPSVTTTHRTSCHPDHALLPRCKNKRSTLIFFHRGNCSHFATPVHTKHRTEVRDSQKRASRK